MKKEVIDICPDCGGELDGDICVVCGIRWSFLGIKDTDTNKKTRVEK